jgi:hypothetical protein
MANKKDDPILCKICELPIKYHVYVREGDTMDETCVLYFGRFKDRYPDRTHKQIMKLTKGRVRRNKRGIPQGRAL